MNKNPILLRSSIQCYKIGSTRNNTIKNKNEKNKLTFGVLSPAFKGNEGNIAVNDFAKQGCPFFKDKLCELFGGSFQPLECRYCHHTRPGLGEKCHRAIEKDWHTKEGQQLVISWGKLTGFWQHYGYIPWAT